MSNKPPAAQLILENQTVIMCALCIVLDAVGDTPQLSIARSLARLRLTDAIHATRDATEGSMRNGQCHDV